MIKDSGGTSGKGTDEFIGSNPFKKARIHNLIA